MDDSARAPARRVHRRGLASFGREDGLRCVVNFADEPARLPGHRTLLLASGPLADGLLPKDTAVWLRA